MPSIYTNISKPSYDPFFIKQRHNGTCTVYERRGKNPKLIGHYSNQEMAIARIAELKNIESDGPYFFDRDVGMTPDDVSKAKSLERQIMLYMAHHSNQSFTARDIHRIKAFGTNLLTSVRRCLTNLYNKGALEVVGLKKEVYGVNNKLYQWKK